MWRDTIIEEIRKGREEHAAQFNYDIRAIMESLKEEERQSGRNVISFADESDKNSKQKTKRHNQVNQADGGISPPPLI